MTADAAIVAAGVVAILLLGELALKKAIRLAAHFGLSGTFLGLSLLSIGTSIPEIVTHIVGSVSILRDTSRMRELSGILIGTNIGSDIFQQDFVIPVVAILGVMRVSRGNLVAQGGGLVVASLLLWLAVVDNRIARWEGALLVGAYLVYLGWLSRDEAETKPIEGARGFSDRRHVAGTIVVIATVFGAMAWVAEQVLTSATALVAQLPLSASFFGVIVLGVATALPELTTALLSIVKGRPAISAGVLIGSNITNPLLAAGLGALMSGYTVPAVIVVFDLPVKLVTAGLLVVFFWRREDLNRWEACALIAAFLAYLGARSAYFPRDFPVGA